MVSVGNVSYSAYLWHWPVLGYFVYPNVDFGSRLGDHVIFIVVLSALVTATYQTVEKHRFKISPAYSLVLLAGFVTAIYALAMVTRDHLRFDPVKRNIFATAQYDPSSCGHNGSTDTALRRPLWR